MCLWFWCLWHFCPAPARSILCWFWSDILGLDRGIDLVDDQRLRLISLHHSHITQHRDLWSRWWAWWQDWAGHVSFLLWEAPLSSSFFFIPRLHSLEGSHEAQPHLRKEVLCSLRAENAVNYLGCICVSDLSFSSLLNILIYSFIFITMDSWVYLYSNPGQLSFIFLIF